jgi:hypothetical protein
MSPAKPGSPITMLNGQTYAVAPGVVLDVPDQHADALGSNGWLVIGQSGPTSVRPTTRSPGRYMAQQGDEFYDTTLGKLLTFDGATWRDPSNGAAV